MSSQKEKKPTLTGQRIRSRKRDEKTKYEPEAFRDILVKELNDAGDFEKAGKFLEKGNTATLDYRRYAESFFDILLTGGLLAPGGDIEGDEDELSLFCVFNATDETSLKEYASLFDRLTRRYKYLQVSLESEMNKVLKFIRAFDESKREKLAQFTAFLLDDALVSPKVLEGLFLEVLVKDGSSLKFVTRMFQCWLEQAGIGSIVKTLSKAKMDNRIVDFFPSAMQSKEKMQEHFKEAGGLEDFVKWLASAASSDLKKTVQSTVTEMLNDEAEQKDIIERVKEIIKDTKLSSADIIAYIWSGVMDEDWNKKADDFVLRHVKSNLRLLKAFSQSHEAQLNLIVKMQNTCYENQRLMDVFQKMVLLMYKADVLEENAIMEWYNKAHSSKGKTVFLEQMKKMVDWLSNAEEESSDEED